jgi:hypothetical protein
MDFAMSAKAQDYHKRTIARAELGKKKSAFATAVTQVL